MNAEISSSLALRATIRHAQGNLKGAEQDIGQAIAWAESSSGVSDETLNE